MDVLMYVLLGRRFQPPSVATVAIASYRTFVIYRRKTMAKLSGADFDGVLGVLYEAGAVEGAVPFPEGVLDALRGLVPCDVVSYHEGVVGHSAVASSGDYQCSGSPEIASAYAEYLHQDPLLPVRGARKVSDILSARAFRDRELYQYVYRPLGVEDTFRLWLDPDPARGARLEFDRSRRDFAERDRHILDVLQPHLAQFYKRAVGRRRASFPLSGGDDRLTPREREILEHVAAGLMNAEIAVELSISPLTVRRHLENVFKKLGVRTRTAAVAAATSARRGFR
jgi:DNA-binding CsgD family transcriptional regulator